MKKFLALIPLISICLAFLFFYSPVFFGKVPAPLDTLVGLNHPYLDYFAKGDPTFRGIPFKNFLIGDPVTQIIPWKSLVVSLFTHQALPLWNPYQMAGYPLLANIQSSAFYPLNVFLFLPFLTGWTILIISQQVLACFFMYLYLKNLRLEKNASLLGGFVFAFCGFSIAWLEWGTILSTALWLPVLLYAIDKFSSTKHNKWLILLTGGFICSYLGGHLQTFFYSSVLSGVYLLCRAYQIKEWKTVFYGISGFVIGGIILSPLIIPQFQLLSLSGRNIDQDWHQIGWFIPWQHLVQFLAPDFFGNPTTLNYWGVWNYGEFIGYIGIIPFMFALSAVFFRRDKKTKFFLSIILIALAFSLQTILAKMPFRLHIPFLSSTQPTRLIYLVDFSLCVLTALGFDYIQKVKVRLFIPAITLFSLLVLAFLGGFLANIYHVLPVNAEWKVTQRNLILPFGFSVVACVLALVYTFSTKKEGIKQISLLAFILVSLLDLVLFANKFTPFATREYFYPKTKIISFLQKNLGTYRIMSTDRSILHPNITTYYHIQSVDGYDPLYLLRYGEFIAAMERIQPNITPPFGFNRIITPNFFFEKFGSLLGVKYLLSQQELDQPYLKKVYTEGTIHVYQNKNVFPRAFFVPSIVQAKDKQETIDLMFKPNLSLRETAVVETIDPLQSGASAEDTAVFMNYEPNTIVIKTHTARSSFLVVTDAYYPTWRAYVDGKMVKIYRTDYLFRGVVVPAGSHTVEFKDQLF